MSHILLVYDTGEGQTAKVAERIDGTLGERGHDVDRFDVTDLPDLAVDDYDGALVGSSIHLGKHGHAAAAFVRDHRDALATRPSGFFEVCLSAASDDPERRAAADRYVEEFVTATGWDPDRVGVFAGALRYSEYGFLKRAMMKRIAREATGDTDTSRDYEYTDWNAVEAFAEAFAAFVDERAPDAAVSD